MKFVYHRVENLMGKGENAVYQHFLLFPQCFLKASFSGCLKLGLCGKWLNRNAPLDCQQWLDVIMGESSQWLRMSYPKLLKVTLETHE